MKKTLLIVFILWGLAIPTVSQVLLTALPKDSVFQYYEQFKIFQSLDTLLSIQHEDAIDIGYFHKSQCIHDGKPFFKLVRFDSILMEVIFYETKPMRTQIYDTSLISKYKCLSRTLNKSYLLQRNQQMAECEFDFILIKDRNGLSAFAVGYGGFTFSGVNSLPKQWFELFSEILLLPDVNIDEQMRKGKQKNNKSKSKK